MRHLFPAAVALQADLLPQRLQADGQSVIELKQGELVKDAEFTLFEAVGALEVGSKDAQTIATSSISLSILKLCLYI